MKIDIISSIFPPNIGGPASYLTNYINDHLYDGNIISFIENSIFDFDKNIKVNNSANIIKLINLNTTKNSYWYRLIRWNLKSYIHFGLSRKAINNKVVLCLDPIYALLILIGMKDKTKILRYVGDSLWEYYGRTRPNIRPLHQFNPKKLNEKIMRVIFRKVLDYYDFIFTPSKFLKNFLMNYYKINENKIKVIYNPINLELEDSIDPEKKLTELGKSNDNYNFKFTFAGRLVKWKNIDLSISLFEKLSHNYPNARLEIIGDGPIKEDLIWNYKSNNKIKFLGKMSRNNLHENLKRSDYFILLSSYEGLSHAAIEAWQLGNKLLLSDIPSNLELYDLLNGVDVDIFSLEKLKSSFNKEVEGKKMKLYQNDGAIRKIEKFTKTKHMETLNKFYLK